MRTVGHHPLRSRDYIESFLKAFGTRIDPADVPADLEWRTWRPCVQRIYYWHWAVRDGYLWGRLECAYGGGGIWRVAFTAPLARAWAAIARHVGPSGAAVLAAPVLVSCPSLA